MRAILQRVQRAKVEVDQKVVGEIGPGWLIFLGVRAGDQESDLDYLADKCLNLRAFSDPDGKMNLSIVEKSAEILVVSQFTLYGDCRKGRRPGFSEAAPPEIAERFYNEFVSLIRRSGLKVATGTFRAHMNVELVNDGPVTLILDSQKLV